MTMLLDTEKRRFMPGTTGWTADDLLDPKIERLWENGAYEIVEGVLTIVPPAEINSGRSLVNLIVHVTGFMKAGDIRGGFAIEGNFIIGKHRVARIDALLLLDKDLARHRRTGQASRRIKSKGRIGRLTQPPLLVIELISLGHEVHDRVVKRTWYEEAGVPHFWILDELKRTLECFRHNGERFVADAKGKGDDVVRPSLFRGLEIPLDELWV